MGVCVGCGTPALDDPPISRRDFCPKCMADLHACRQCFWYDIRVSKQCREPMAEWVADKEKANFCDYFRFDPQIKVKVADKEAQRTKLEALFKNPKPK